MYLSFILEILNIEAAVFKKSWLYGRVYVSFIAANSLQNVVRGIFHDYLGIIFTVGPFKVYIMDICWNCLADMIQTIRIRIVLPRKFQQAPIM